MAVNPKLIAVIAESLSSEQGRNTVLKIIMVVIGLIMMIFTAFAGFISGLLDIIQTTDLQNHWRYIRTCISEVFDGMNAEIDGDIKREVYDFMPDFSVNLLLLMSLIQSSLKRTTAFRFRALTDLPIMAQ